MFAVQINFGGKPVTLKNDYPSLAHAETAIAEFRQTNRCYGDPFRVINIDEGPLYPAEAMNIPLPT